jgi:DNA repair protein RecO (recombination protein O)
MADLNRIDLEPAYILHARAYRETSQILEVFTAGHGRLTFVARGARRPKSALRGILNPFQSLRLSWSGRGEMQTLREAEPAGPLTNIDNAIVMSCFYINELILKLLERSDPHPDLFAHYTSLMMALQSGQPVEPLLRMFELQLLGEIGYAPNLNRDAATHAPVDADRVYEFVADYGVVEAGVAAPAAPVFDHGVPVFAPAASVFKGSSLLAISRQEFSDTEVMRDAKRLLREILNFHLGNRALHTRRVASAMNRTG